jgi:hypothetical protein
LNRYEDSDDEAPVDDDDEEDEEEDEDAEEDEGDGEPEGRHFLFVCGIYLFLSIAPALLMSHPQTSS